MNRLVFISPAVKGANNQSTYVQCHEYLKNQKVMHYIYFQDHDLNVSLEDFLFVIDKLNEEASKMKLKYLGKELIKVNELLIGNPTTEAGKGSYFLFNNKDRKIDFNVLAWNSNNSAVSTTAEIGLLYWSILRWTLSYHAGDTSIKMVNYMRDGIDPLRAYLMAQIQSKCGDGYFACHISTGHIPSMFTIKQYQRAYKHNYGMYYTLKENNDIGNSSHRGRQLKTLLKENKVSEFMDKAKEWGLIID
jgi:hypothetical protein